MQGYRSSLELKLAMTKTPPSRTPFRNFDFRTLDSGHAYKILISAVVPRPIALISTLSPEGIVNVAPFSFFNAVSSKPPVIMFSATKKAGTGNNKDTLTNIERTGEFVVNICSEWFLHSVNETAVELNYNESELVHSGLNIVASDVVKPPGILESAVRFECEILKMVPIPDEKNVSATAVFGRILNCRVEERVSDSQGIIDWQKLAPVSRLGGLFYGFTDRVEEIARPKKI